MRWPDGTTVPDIRVKISPHPCRRPGAHCRPWTPLACFSVAGGRSAGDVFRTIRGLTQNRAQRFHLNSGAKTPGGKSEAGLADYQTRSWWGWHHHQTLSMLAIWFLVLETRRGKKGDASADTASGARGNIVDPAPRVWLRPTGANHRGEEAAIEVQRTGAVLSLQEA